MDFGKAIQLLKEGKKLQREGWNGKKTIYRIGNKYKLSKYKRRSNKCRTRRDRK